ncbi:MAG: glycosyl hydrolase family protein [Planctomycetes bacterium]|nr:glycosyl hydrolase family protein [Planctomycetota bacterium]
MSRPEDHLWARETVGMAAALWAAVAGLACGLRGDPARAAASDYPHIAWQDEFDGPALEPARWTHDIGTGSQYGLTGWGNNELQYYTDRSQNLTVSGGLLQITARSESYGGKSYTSARIKTQDRFSQAGGRFEIRAALPTGQGFWPALWMMPASDVYGGWAASGEIDIMEAKGQQPDRIQGTIHYGGAWPNNTSTAATRVLPPGQTIASFHTYSLEWDIGSSSALRWYVDDVLYATRTSWWSAGGSYPAPFDKPFYLLVNLAVGGNYVGSPNGSTVFPATMQVDYVRAYTAALPAITLAAPAGTRTQATVGNPAIKAAATVTKTGTGTLQLTSSNAYTGPTFVQAGRLELAHAAAAAGSAVRVAAGSTLAVAGSLDTTIGGLSIDAGGRVDLGAGRLTVASGMSAATAVSALVAARGTGGWNGSAGIGSSVVAAAAAAGESRAIGWSDAGNGSLRFVPTAPGDATLDGMIDILDVAEVVAAGKFNSSLAATWSEGDFNYDGLVDILDVADLATTGLYGAGAFAVSGTVAAVPEPAAACLVAAALTAALPLVRSGRRPPPAAGRTTGRSPGSRRRSAACS